MNIFKLIKNTIDFNCLYEIYWLGGFLLIRNNLLWTPVLGHTSVGHPAKSFLLINFVQTLDAIQSIYQE